jgi:hypothetical protein
MEAWRDTMPQDAINEQSFFAQKNAKRKARRESIRVRKAFIAAQEAGPSTIPGNDPRWEDLSLSDPSELSDSDFDFYDV